MSCLVGEQRAASLKNDLTRDAKLLLSFVSRFAVVVTAAAPRQRTSSCVLFRSVQRLVMLNSKGVSAKVDKCGYFQRKVLRQTLFRSFYSPSHFRVFLSLCELRNEQFNQHWHGKSSSTSLRSENE